MDEILQQLADCNHYYRAKHISRLKEVVQCLLLPLFILISRIVIETWREQNRRRRCVSAYVFNGTIQGTGWETEATRAFSPKRSKSDESGIFKTTE